MATDATSTGALFTTGATKRARVISCGRRPAIRVYDEMEGTEADGLRLVFVVRLRGVSAHFSIFIAYEKEVFSAATRAFCPGSSGSCKQTMVMSPASRTPLRLRTRASASVASGG